jgi:hypothetical protein
MCQRITKRSNVRPPSTWMSAVQCISLNYEAVWLQLALMTDKEQGWYSKHTQNEAKVGSNSDFFRDFTLYCGQGP